MADLIIRREKLENERRRLQKVSAILTCAVWAANHDVEADYGDVLSAVRELVDQAVVALDTTSLRG